MKEIENTISRLLTTGRINRFGFERMVELLALRVAIPILNSRFSIGGTNAKGSTIAFLKKMLEKLELRVMTCLAPYISFITQTRLASMGNRSQKRLEALTADYISLCWREKVSPIYGTTEFVRISQLAYDYFASQSVDVWLSWKLAWVDFWIVPVCHSLLTGITTIVLDIKCLLVETLEAIEQSRRQVLSNKVSPVTGRIAQEAFTVIDRIAEGKDAPRDAYGTHYQGFIIKSVETGEESEYTSAVRQGRSQTKACLVCTK